MAQRATSTPLDGDFPDTIASEDELASTATLDLFNGAVSIRSITIDASGIAASKIYVKIYDSVTVDPSSDVPDVKFPVAQNEIRTLTIVDGLSFSTAFSVRAVTGSPDANTTPDSSPGPGYFVGT